MVRRAAQASLILLLAGLLLGLGVASPAQAHARLLRSDPPDNAILTAAPARVQLWFSEALTPQLSGARLLDINGREVAGLSITTDAAQPTWMAVELPALGEGVYSLNWKVFSAVDGHYNQGVLVFGVGAGANVSAAASGEQGEQPTAVELVARWLSYLGLAALTGALGVYYLQIPIDDLGFQTRRRLAGWMALSAGLAWLAGWGLLAGQLRAAPALGALLGTRWAGLWLARQVCLLLAIGLALWLWQSFRGGRAFVQSLRPALLVVLALGAMASVALNSHAAGAAESSLLPLLADGLHLVSIGLWAGGVLALLALALRPRLLEAGLVRRFTPRAMLYVGLTFASGLISSAQQVASLDALLFTPYGQALLLKVGLVMGVGVLGLVNMRIADSKAKTPGKHSWRVIALEGALMCGVLALTALLTSSAPANTLEYRLAGVQQPELLSRQVDDLLVSFQARPNRPGQNLINLRVNSTLRPPPAEVQRVILHLRYLEQNLGQQTLEAEALPGSDGQYQAGGGALSLPGAWEVQVVVRRKGLLDVVAQFTWVVYPLAEVPAVRLAAFPLAWLALPGAGVALLAAGAGLWRLRRKR